MSQQGDPEKVVREIKCKTRRKYSAEESIRIILDGIGIEARIAEHIWDGNDDPSIHGFVLYEPFATSQIGTEQQSWGQVKALYR
jgi:hypothetical protein